MTIGIIGAGVAGYCAAIEAARAGAEVVVLDAREQVGGRARTREHDGFLLNEGAHALYVDGPANRYLRSIGREPAGGAPDPAAGIGVDGAVTGPLPAGIGSLLRTPLLRGDRTGLMKLFARVGRMDAAEFATATVSETLEQLLGHGPGSRVGHAFARLATYANDPDRASGDAVIAQIALSAGGGVRYVDGGWQTIVDSLAAEAAMLGIEVRTGAKVTAIEPIASGVEVGYDGGALPVDAVVLALGGPRQTHQLLDGRSAAVEDWADAARPAAVASLDVGLDVAWGSFPTFALGIDQPLYLSVHAPVAQLAPAGHTLVNVSRYLDPEEPDDGRRDRAQCEELLDRVRPGWRDHAAHVEFRRRLVTAFDQPKAATGGLAGRPDVALPDLDGVFVAGDWVGPTGLLVDAAVSSGRRAGRQAASRRTVAVP